ncbi:pre-peptidase C-terminal domain-containing protein [Micromonospora viridifaciens]|uniref:Pre-peptidase C-terminal domain-containing protein n=1 Tax=Micromonospora viridifaciens TaxID=1881 RepID=A0A1C4X2M7_MICVI|nr:S8 family serine peptidase [Micromonospora viridifaciens]SCF02699.1 pre-peptidase C-terminal domain-containing protein [Micromonospora viridifaciens]
MTPPVVPPSRRARRAVAALATSLVVGGLSLSAVPAHADPAAAPVADKLGSHDRALIAKYAAQHRARAFPAGARQQAPDFVTLMLAVKSGTTEAAARQLTELGADVTRTDAEVGYVKVNVPFALVDQVVALDNVLRVDADELLKLEDTTVDAGTEGAAAGSGGLPAAPTAATPDNNPYMPTRETGSVAFKNEHPSYDGRGVTIGIMDTGIDPTHPALATTTTGERKLVDTVVGTNPLNLIDALFIENTWTLVNTSATSSDRVTGPTAVKQNITWTLPDAGCADMYLKTRLYSGVRLADKTLTGYQGIAFCGTDGSVWVDTDNDRVFAADELIRPYHVDHQIGYLGTDNPATAINERQPFTVEAKQLTSTYVGININTIEVDHGTHVAGITAANGMLGGQMNGQAPGAKLVSMRACTSGGCSSAALTDGMIDLATKYGVDVINMSIGSSPALNDGQSAMALLYNRLIDQTGVQMFVSAGNSGAGSNTVGDPSLADKVVSVGASVSKQTWWANYGSFVHRVNSVFPFSSRGPREDGGFKPDITAPGAAISTVPGWIAEAPVASTGYTLPVGYAMLQGTSMASPQAAGAAALLLSAAKQNGISATPAELRDAIYSTADFNKDEPAIAQGRGQFNVIHAWQHLAKGVADTDDVTASAPVCTVLSGRLVQPNAGSGLYNNCAPGSGGQAVGEARTYEVTLTRTSGPDAALSYDVDLQGNDGTFTAPKKVTLAKDVPTVVEVAAAPATQGIHSAVLTIDNPKTRAVERSVMLAVEAAAPLVAGQTWSAEGTVNRNETITYSVAVPAGTTSLTVNLSGLAADSQTRWWAFTPEGVTGERSSAGTAYCYANYLDGNGCNPLSRTYTNPKAGVWEFVVEARRTSPQFANPYHLEATVTR